MKPNKLELILIVAMCVLAALVFAGCDSYARATAAPTFNVTVTPSPQPPTSNPAPVVIVAPMQDVTTLIGPPTDRDVPFNEQEATSDQPQAPSCEPKNNGRGQGTGAPGNGKGRGGEKGCAE